MIYTKDETSIVFKKYSKDILNYSYSLLKNYDEAKDAVQEVFLRYIKNRNGFRGDCAEKTWLLTIARNYCLNKITRRKITADEEIDDYDLIPSECDITDKLTLEDAINKLSPKDHELLYLREYAGYSYQEMAEILGMSLDNVKISLFRVRQKLKKILE
ncbi:MAG TPA: RNA polymerase sigma factor [Ignavibacteriales bacterium]|nr:RNA polymerase sigma factor [Ignavibacteriales bacterium]